MKKYLACIFSIVILFSLSACAKSTTENKKEEDKAVGQMENSEEEKLIAPVTKQDKENLKEEKEEKVKLEEKQNLKENNKEKAKTEEKDNSKEGTVKNKKVIVIDPGHSSGGNKGQERQSPDSNVLKIKDPGGAQGVVSKTPEYAINMKVALKLKALLEKDNYKVIMTKTQHKENPGNVERAEVGNSNKADLVIRIHCDSSDNQKVQGASMLVPGKTGYGKSINSISKQYGQIILESLVNECKMSSKGVVERNDLTGFNWSKVPVVLVEMGFMSNPKEDQMLEDEAYQNKLAQGLFKGIKKAMAAI